MKNISKIYFFLFSIFLVLPLIFTGSTLFPWLFGKTILFQILIEIFCILFFIVAWKQKNFVLRQLNALDVSIFLFLGVLIITSLTGESFTHSFWPNQARAIGVFTWLHFGLLYFFLIQCVEKNDWWKKFFRVSIIVAIIIGLSALFKGLLPEAWDGDPGGTRLSGILGNPAFFAAYMLVHVGLSLFLFFFEKNKLWKYLFALTTIFFSLTIAFSGIRGAFLGMVAGFFAVVFVLGLSEVKTSKKLFARVGVIVLSCILLLGSIFFSIKTFGTTGLPLSVQRVFDYSLAENGIPNTRILAWDVAWHGFLERPVLGWGWGNYNAVFDTFFDPRFLHFSFQETVWDKPHNAFLEMFVASGILGLSFVSIFVILLIFVFSQFLQQSKQEKQQQAALCFIVVAYAVQDFFLFDLTNALIPFIFVCAFLSFQWSENRKISVQSFNFDLHRTFVIVPLLLVLIFSIGKNIDWFQASTMVKRTQQSTDIFSFNKNALLALEKQVPFQEESAIFLAERMVNLDKVGAFTKENISFIEPTALELKRVLEDSFLKQKNRVQSGLWAAQIDLILGQWKDESYYANAETLLLAAHDRAPQKQEILFLLGRLYLLKKDFSSAIQVQEKAVALEPTIGVSHWFLGLTKIAQGNVDQGLLDIENAFEMKYVPKHDERLYVIDVYAQQKQYIKIAEQYKILLLSDPENVEWYVKLATAYALAGDKVLALETVEKAVHMYPQIAGDAEKFIQEYNLR